MSSYVTLDTLAVIQSDNGTTRNLIVYFTPSTNAIYESADIYYKAKEDTVYQLAGNTATTNFTIVGVADEVEYYVKPVPFNNLGLATPNYLLNYASITTSFTTDNRTLEYDANGDLEPIAGDINLVPFETGNATLGTVLKHWLAAYLDYAYIGTLTVTNDIDMDTHQVTALSTPTANGEAIRQTIKITEALLESATDLKHEAVTVSSPISLSTQAISLINNAAITATITAIDVDGTFIGNSDTVIPTQKATKTYTDTKTTLAEVKADIDIAEAISLKHDAVTASAPISITIQSLSLVNDIGTVVTEIDTGVLANLDTVIPTSKAVTTALAGVGGGGLTWTTISSATNAITENGYMCDTSGGAFTLTLLGSPSEGDIVAVTDGAGTFDIYNLTIDRNSLKIMGLSEDMTVSTKYAAFALIYNDATNGWRLLGW
jgi:hypothetical protein